MLILRVVLFSREFSDAHKTKRKLLFVLVVRARRAQAKKIKTWMRFSIASWQRRESFLSRSP